MVLVLKHSRCKSKRIVEGLHQDTKTLVWPGNGHGFRVKRLPLVLEETLDFWTVMELLKTMRLLKLE